MRKLKFVSVFALVALLLSATPVMGQEPLPQDQVTGSTSGTCTSRGCGCYDYHYGRTCPYSPNGYIHYVYKDGSRWRSVASGLYWYSGDMPDGTRYTHDVHLYESWHLSADGWYITNFSDPKYDRDCDASWLCPEAEVTATDASFPKPAPQKSYYFHARWKKVASGSGILRFSAQLSQWFGEWQTCANDLLSGRSFDTGTRDDPASKAEGTVRSNAPAMLPTQVMHSTLPETKADYVVTSQNGEVNVDIHTRIRSDDDLMDYLTAVRELAQDLKRRGTKKGPVVVTFRRPLSPGEFEAFVDAYKLKPTSFEARVAGEDDSRQTVGGVPERGDVFPENVVEEMTEGTGTHLVGITSCEGVLRMDQYDAADADPRTFLVDVLPIKIAFDVRSSGALEELNEGEILLDINLNDVYWKMEKFQ